MSLTEEDFVSAAKELGCEVAAIKAVAEVEAPGGGFLDDNTPKILFEAHIFSRLTNGRYNITHPRLSSPTWNRALYLGGKREHTRLQMAVRLDKDCALMSCSWGKFQIMGENYKLAGYGNLRDFINDMFKDESAHLKAFVGFIKSAGLVSSLKKRNWKLFARKYNGPSYWKNHYDVKLEAAYKKFLH